MKTIPKNNEENEIFPFRIINTDEGEYIIAIGDRMATEDKFQSRKDAENYISQKSYKLIMSLIITIVEFNNKSNQKENGNTNR